MKISVALCTYNGEVYLKEQVDSILNQTMNVAKPRFMRRASRSTAKPNDES